MKSAKDQIADTIDRIAPDISRTDRQTAIRELTMTLSACLISDGYTLAMAGESLGVPKTTLSGWQAKYSDYAELLAEHREASRRWLIAQCKLAIEGGEAADGTLMGPSRAAGKAMNILANLWCPELRSTKVEATVAAVPEAGSSRADILAAVNKSKPLE